MVSRHKCHGNGIFAPASLVGHRLFVAFEHRVDSAFACLPNTSEDRMYYTGRAGTEGAGALIA
jgi:hypothetical protein